MLSTTKTRRFKTDLKKISKKQKEKVNAIKEKLEQGKILDKMYRDHELAGNFKSFRECHVDDDLLLIYRVEEDNLILCRVGNHSNLFG